MHSAPNSMLSSGTVLLILGQKDIHQQQILSWNIWYSHDILPRKIYIPSEAQDCICWNSVSWAFQVYSTSTDSKFTQPEKLKINPNINDVTDWREMLKSNAHQCWPRTTNAAKGAHCTFTTHSLPYITEGHFAVHELQRKPAVVIAVMISTPFFSDCIPHNRQKLKTCAIPPKTILHSPTQENS